MRPTGKSRPDAVGTAVASIDAGLLSRVRKTSIILGLVMAAPIATYFGLFPAAGWCLGIAWSLVNLIAIGSIVRNILTLEPRNRSVIAVGVALKVVVLYAIAAFLLVVLDIPALWWVAGFTWPLFVAIMKSAGRSYLGLDAGNTPRSEVQ